MRARLVACAVVVLALVPAAPAAAARPKKVPSNFVGTVADGPLLENPNVDLAGQLGRMVTNGVQTLRTVFNWAGAQPYKTFNDVPMDQRDRFRDENGVPTDYSKIDELVTAAAERRIAVLPIVMIAPMWDARHPGQLSSPPQDFQPYYDFAAAVARRYGPGGSFWSEHPELVAQPIRYWQIWNEPSFKVFWSDQPFATDYVELLRGARDAIRAVDPGARIVLAGLANKSWTALSKIYKAGGGPLFDVAAFHPFTDKVDGVRQILVHDRQVMAGNGDARKPLWVTELSWTSAKGKTSVTYGNEQTERGQARRLAAAYTMLAKQRRKLRIGRVYWYTWVTPDKQRDYPFDWAGLLRVTSGGVKAKPALGAFRRTTLALEHCRTKRGRADRCAS
ncbi:MAG: polysaccharide biosynthesis protein PslG [Thermoleophilaceae bacterium]|nr:polysaccharide biosynthesis protein PslG [Thermoleophilaceae bacterium]